jgi:hypothetical protein
VFYWTRFVAFAAFVSAVGLAQAATFSADSTITFTTADLSAKNISITWSALNPITIGISSGNAGVASDAVDSGSGPAGGPASQLNLTMEAYANGYAETVGSAKASAQNTHSITFTNTGAVAQQFDVDFSYVISSDVAAGPGQSANASSSAAAANNVTFKTFFTDEADAYTPFFLTANGSDSNDFGIVIGAGRSATIIATAYASGYAVSAVPEPVSVLGLGVGVLILGRRRRTSK